MKPIITNLSLKIASPYNGQYTFSTETDWHDAPIGITLSLFKFRDNDWFFEDSLMLVSFYDIPRLLCQTEPIEFEGWNIMNQLLQL